MPILRDWELALDVDAVLRGQGVSSPEALRQRNPRIAEVASQALEEGRALLEPRVLYRTYEVESLRHERLGFTSGGALTGRLIVQHMGGARRVVVVLCTVGETLERRASELSSEDLVYALALDGVGSAGVEALANAACNHFERQASGEDLQTTIPLSPGMIGWPVEQGQPQIFSLLDPSEVGVHLTPAMLMLPRKSLTFVLGIGSQVIEAGRTCDYCSLHDTCRYQDHYA